jgi:hypothetical protein
MITLNETRTKVANSYGSKILIEIPIVLNTIVAKAIIFKNQWRML